MDATSLCHPPTLSELVEVYSKSCLVGKPAVMGRLEVSGAEGASAGPKYLTPQEHI